MIGLDTEEIPERWLTTIDGDTFPFVEDEDNNLTGFGWLPAGAFAEAVNEYDAALGNAPADPCTMLDVTWRWVKRAEDGEQLVDVDPEDAVDDGAAFQVTAVWGIR